MTRGWSLGPGDQGVSGLSSQIGPGSRSRSTLVEWRSPEHIIKLGFEREHHYLTNLEVLICDD